MSVYSDAILATPGLVSYWRLNETSGTAAADLKATNAGTYVGSPTLNTAGLITDGDKAVTFNGTSQYIDVPSSASIQALVGPFTLESWVNVPTTFSTNDRQIFSRDTGSTATSAWYMQVLAATKQVQVSLRWGTSTKTWNHSSTAAIQIGTTYHVVWSYDKVNSIIYINGVEDARVAHTDSAQNVTTALRIGAKGGTASSFFPGILDELAVYNQALSAATILDHYNKGTAVLVDTTPPIPNITISASPTKISRVVGKDASSFTFQANENIQAWQVRFVPSSTSSYTSGTLIESGGAVAANTNINVTITDDEAVAAGALEGFNTVKVFVQDTAGNWSDAAITQLNYATMLSATTMHQSGGAMI